MGKVEGRGTAKVKGELWDTYGMLVRICRSWKYNKFLVTVDESLEDVGQGYYTFADYEYHMMLMQTLLTEYYGITKKHHRLQKEFPKFIQVYRLEKDKWSENGY